MTQVEYRPDFELTKWWCHEMETVSTSLAICEGNPLVTGGFSSQKASNTGFGVFFDVSLNKRLNTQSSRRWFKTTGCSLWRHCIEIPNYSDELQGDWTYITVQIWHGRYIQNDKHLLLTPNQVVVFPKLLTKLPCSLPWSISCTRQYHDVMCDTVRKEARLYLWTSFGPLCAEKYFVKGQRSSLHWTAVHCQL